MAGKAALSVVLLAVVLAAAYDDFGSDYYYYDDYSDYYDSDTSRKELEEKNSDLETKVERLKTRLAGLGFADDDEEEDKVFQQCNKTQVKTHASFCDWGTQCNTLSPELCLCTTCVLTEMMLRDKQYSKACAKNGGAACHGASKTDLSEIRNFAPRGAHEKAFDATITECKKDSVLKKCALRIPEFSDLDKADAANVAAVDGIRFIAGEKTIAPRNWAFLLRRWSDFDAGSTRDGRLSETEFEKASGKFNIKSEVESLAAALVGKFNEFEQCDAENLNRASALSVVGAKKVLAQADSFEDENRDTLFATEESRQALKISKRICKNELSGVGYFFEKRKKQFTFPFGLRMEDTPGSPNCPGLLKKRDANDKYRKEKVARACFDRCIPACEKAVSDEKPGCNGKDKKYCPKSCLTSCVVGLVPKYYQNMLYFPDDMKATDNVWFWASIGTLNQEEEDLADQCFAFDMKYDIGRSKIGEVFGKGKSNIRQSKDKFDEVDDSNALSNDMVRARCFQKSHCSMLSYDMGNAKCDKLRSDFLDKHRKEKSAARRGLRVKIPNGVS